MAKLWKVWKSLLPHQLMAANPFQFLPLLSSRRLHHRASRARPAESNNLVDASAKLVFSNSVDLIGPPRLSAGVPDEERFPSPIGGEKAGCPVHAEKTPVSVLAA